MILNKYDGENLTITMTRKDFIGLVAAVIYAATQAEDAQVCDAFEELVLALDLIATKLLNKHEQLKESGGLGRDIVER